MARKFFGMTDMLSAEGAVRRAARLLEERYPQADAAIVAGSFVRGGATAASDIDLVVLFERLPHAFRESFCYEGTPVDVFAHDPETLRAFFGKDVEAGKSATLTMVTEGRTIGPRPEAAVAMCAEARALLAAGPPPLEGANLALFRYLITCRVEDLEDPRPWPEHVATGAGLHAVLADFVLRAHGRWAATAKWIPRTMTAFDPALTTAFDAAFAALFERRDVDPVIAFADEVLAPFHGRLFDGYRADSKPEERVRVGPNAPPGVGEPR